MNTMFRPLLILGTTAMVVAPTFGFAGERTGARVVVTSEDDMGSEFRLVRLQFGVDGSPMLDVEARGGEGTRLLDAELAPGPHTLQVRALYRGHGFGPMAKQRGMQFRSASTHEFLARAGHVVRIKAVWHETGSFLTPLEDRLAIRYEVTSEADASLAAAVAVPAQKTKPGPDVELGSDPATLAIPVAQLAAQMPEPEPEVAHDPEPVVSEPEPVTEAFAASEAVPEVDTVYFGWGKAKLRPSGRAELSALAALMKGDSSLTVDVVGHTDTSGSARFNLRLSERRAKSVVGFLTSHGIAPERLRAVAKGESEPKEDNDSKAGRRMNRRTELIAKRRLDS